MKLARPEMVMKAVWQHTLRLLEKQKASMKFTCAEEALKGCESPYQRNDNILGQLISSTRDGVNVQGTGDIG